MKIKLTCHAARQIDLCQLIISKGGRLYRENEAKATFFSPFRNERTPSFTVCKIRNRWKDWGIDKGGTTIDFIMELESCSVRKSLEILDGNSFGIHQYDGPPERKKNALGRIIKIAPLIKGDVDDYVGSRYIPIYIAKRYLSVAHIKWKGSVEEVLLFKSNSGGVELRASNFKKSFGPKNITTILNHRKTVIVFEGFFNFLSYLAIFNQEFETDFIVLNSTGNLNKAIPVLSKYEHIELYLDNDPAGDSATKDLMSEFENTVDYRNLYKGYNDLNDYLKGFRKTH